ncbi:MAG: hypothetical protein RIS47_1223, partial [Bacteroidota bacterium]
LFSCSEDFLTEENKSGYTEDVIYSSETGLTGLVTTCYAYNRLWYGKEGGVGLTEAGTDLWFDGGDNQQISLATYNGLNGSVYDKATNKGDAALDEYWEMFYAAINNCNTAIKYLEPSTIAKRKQFLGEVQFLRAFYYWHMVETWGAIPLNITPTVSPETAATRSSVEDVYKQMMLDIDAAIENLASITAKSDGRVNIWAAKALKARLSLYTASRTGDAAMYTQAASLAEEVILGSGASFYAKYADTWKMANNDGKINKEAIWYVDYSDNPVYNAIPRRTKLDVKGDRLEFCTNIRRRNESSVQGGSYMYLMFTGFWDKQADLKNTLKRDATVDLQVSRYGKSFRRYGPTPYLLGLFNDAADQRYQGSFRDTWYRIMGSAQVTPTYALMSNSGLSLTDTALFVAKAPMSAEQKAWTVGRYKAVDYSTTYDATGAPTTTGPDANTIGYNMYIALKKFEDDSHTAFLDWSARDIMVFRLSEMYLIAAEGYMMSGQASKAITSFNALRSARAISGKDNSLTTAEQALVTAKNINIVLDERARELCGEQIRWFDLKRTSKLVERVQMHNARAKDYIQSFHVLRPIPNSQLEAVSNPAEFLQNPGYN